MNHYRTIFTGILVQQSALSVGGNSPHAAVDDPLCRDGRNRFTIRGTSLAGALIATAAKIYGPVPSFITGKWRTGEDTSRQIQSLWRFFNSHPEKEQKDIERDVELRQCVAICQETGAAAEGALFDTETLPRGTRWHFCLEVNTAHKDNGLEAEKIAMAALQEWLGGRCHLGRNVARGMGWVALKELQAYRLTKEHVDSWPNSEEEPLTTLNAMRINPTPIGKMMDGSSPSCTKTALYRIRLSGTLEVGKSDNASGGSYGLDCIAVGGHAANLLSLEWNPERYLKPRGKANPSSDFKPDAAIVLTKGKNDLEPFIPGSALRGTIRHALARLLAAEVAGASLVEEGTHTEEMDERVSFREPEAVKKLFGTTETGSPLLVKDAYLDASHEWKAAWVQHHAEDEFSAGVYGSSKFDRIVLVRGVFHWEMIIEAASEAEAYEHYGILSRVFSLAKHGHLPVGGGQWRGLGWPKWKIIQTAIGRVGSDEEEPLSCSLGSKQT